MPTLPGCCLLCQFFKPYTLLPFNITHKGQCYYMKLELKFSQEFYSVACLDPKYIFHTILSFTPHTVSILISCCHCLGHSVEISAVFISWSPSNSTAVHLVLSYHLAAAFIYLCLFMLLLYMPQPSQSKNQQPFQTRVTGSHLMLLKFQ